MSEQKGETRWRLLPDEARTLALLEYFDGVEWKPMPKPDKLETYPSNVKGPAALCLEARSVFEEGTIPSWPFKKTPAEF